MDTALTLARDFPIPGLVDLLRLVPLLLAGALLYWFLLTAVTAHRLTRPPRRTYGWAVARGLPGEPSELDRPLEFSETPFNARGRELSAWDIKGRDADGPAIILTDGWGGSRVSALVRIDHLADLASRVVVWDMPGHGDSPGVCELGYGEVRDLCALGESLGPGWVYYGWSLGAEITLRALAAADLAPRGVVLEGPFRHGLTPAQGVMKQAGYPSLLNLPPALAWVGLRFGGDPARRFRDVLPLCARVSVPALVLHGERDATSPVEDGRAIAEALAGGAFVAVEDAGHHDLWLSAGARDASVSAVARHLRALGGSA